MSAPRQFAGGRYVVRRPLGEGGQKAVFLVYDAVLDRECALALIREAMTPESAARLRHEARALARMGAHPNIVGVYDLGDDGGAPYIVCEYVPGGDLAEELARSAGQVSVTRAVAVARDVLRALACAHERGVVHRDVKPGNVWIADGGAAKLGDFGLALASDRSRMTVEGGLAGTPAYAAPEQLEGAALDARADLYAVGCLLYEMLTGRPPFVGSLVSVISQHLHAAPTPPMRLNPEVSAALEALVLRLLAKRADDRPASANEALALLEAAGGDALPVGSAETLLPSTSAARAARAAGGDALPVGSAETLLEAAGGDALPVGSAETLLPSTSGTRAALAAGGDALPVGSAETLLPSTSGTRAALAGTDRRATGAGGAVPAATDMPAPRLDESAGGLPTIARARAGRRWIAIVAAAILLAGAGVLLELRLAAPPPPATRRLAILPVADPAGAPDAALAWALASRLVEEVDHFREFRPVSPAGLVAARRAVMKGAASLPDAVEAAALARHLGADTVAGLAIAPAPDGELTVALHVFSTDDPAMGRTSMRTRLTRADLDGAGPDRLAGDLMAELVRHWGGALTDEMPDMPARPVDFDAWRQYVVAEEYCLIGRWDQCEARARAALAMEPDNALFHALLGCALAYQAGREAEAEAAGMKAVELAGRLRSRHDRLHVEQNHLWIQAERARQKGEVAKSRELAKRVIEIDTELARTWRDPWGYLYAAAATQYFLEDTPRARALYAEVRRLAPDLYSAWHEEAKLLRGDGTNAANNRDAARLLWTFITCYPDSELAPVASVDAKQWSLPKPEDDVPCAPSAL